MHTNDRRIVVVPYNDRTQAHRQTTRRAGVGDFAACHWTLEPEHSLDPL